MWGADRIQGSTLAWAQILGMIESGCGLHFNRSLGAQARRKERFKSNKADDLSGLALSEWGQQLTAGMRQQGAALWRRPLLLLLLTPCIERVRVEELSKASRTDKSSVWWPFHWRISQSEIDLTRAAAKPESLPILLICSLTYYYEFIYSYYDLLSRR